MRGTESSLTKQSFFLLPVKVAHVGINGSSVTNEIRGIRMIRPEDALADEQRLSPHFIRVHYQVVQRLHGRHLVGVIVGQLCESLGQNKYHTIDFSPPEIIAHFC